MERVDSLKASEGTSEAESALPKEDHARGLLLVGIFKLSKAIFFSLVGVGALKLVHRDLGEVVMHLVDVLHFDPESRLVGFLMDRADLIGHHQLRQASMFAFSYAALCLVEGWGLVTQTSWAEYFTVILTTAALPWESYELVERFEPYKVGLLLTNIVVLIYLLWVLKRKRIEEDGGERLE